MAFIKRLVERVRRRIRRDLGIDAIDARLGVLENWVRDHPSHVSESLKHLAIKTVEGRPHGNYFNERFRDYELVLANVKLLGYQLGRMRAEAVPEPAVAAPPNTGLTSRMCIQDDFESEWFAFWRNETRIPPSHHRKLWELCYVAQAIFIAGKLQPGSAGLGFGCGEEPLPSLFAKYGASVLVTDQEPSEAERQGWTATGQHALNIDKLRMAHVCPDPAKLAMIDLRYVDMNAIPADLAGKFDFCWSVCALEHLGSIANGLDFIENSLKTLKPGGVAVHTLEYNLANDGETIDNWPTVLFQRKHLAGLAERLTRKGYFVSELDFSSGHGVLDGFVDVPPWRTDGLASPSRMTHMKLSVDGFICTSFGVIIRAPAAAHATASADHAGSR